MGQLVGAFCTSHIAFSSRGVEEKARRVIEGFQEIGRRLRAARPDVLVIASSEHGPSLLPLGPQPPFTVGIGETIETYGEMSIPKVHIPGHRQFARAFIRAAREAGFDIASIEDLRADHGVALPLLLALPEHSIPIVPLIININAPDVMPTPQRCYQLGHVLRRLIETRPQEERIAVMGTGGLSHWVGVPEMGRVNEDFDRKFLDLLASGKGAEAAKWSPEHILEEAGNGGQEIRTWIFVAGTVGEAGGEVLYYEPIPQWLTGMGAFSFHCA